MLWEALKLAENCGKYATESQSQKQLSGGAGADEVQARTLAAFFVNDFLSIVEAAAALHFATVAAVSRLGSRRSTAGRLADLALRDSVADADDHGDRYNR
jgi:hypothetical protein